MQFRIIGKKIQCLRSYYNAEKKRGEQKMILSIDADMEELPNDLSSFSDFQENELEQLRQWLEKRKIKINAEKIQKTIDTAPNHISEIDDAIKKNPEYLTKIQARLLIDALNELMETLATQGFSETKSKASNQSVSLYTNFKGKIIRLKTQGSSIREISEQLKKENPNLSNSISYNGLRSYIRRHKL